MSVHVLLHLSPGSAGFLPPSRHSPLCYADSVIKTHVEACSLAHSLSSEREWRHTQTHTHTLSPGAEMQQQDSLLSADPMSGKQTYGLISLLFLLFLCSSHSFLLCCFPWSLSLCLNSVPLSLHHCNQEVLVWKDAPFPYVGVVGGGR